MAVASRTRRLFVHHCQLPLVVGDEHDQEFGRFGRTGVAAHDMVRARRLKPAFAGPEHLFRFTLDLRPDLAGQHKGIDECVAMAMSRRRGARPSPYDDRRIKKLNLNAENIARMAIQAVGVAANRVEGLGAGYENRRSAASSA